ncbi:hypothetical protein ACLGI4_00645 [Streptomyces sp. HMX112]|uniref:hypothetical protein n=1 Tax=Streptomyces sp. HMX112 TaxID=3390850 RepID=UPI003A800EA4
MNQAKRSSSSLRRSGRRVGKSSMTASISATLISAQAQAPDSRQRRLVPQPFDRTAGR